MGVGASLVCAKRPLSVCLYSDLGLRGISSPSVFSSHLISPSLLCVCVLLSSLEEEMASAFFSRHLFVWLLRLPAVLQNQP